MSFGKVHRINAYYMGNSSTLEALNFLYDAFFTPLNIVSRAASQTSQHRVR